MIFTRMLTTHNDFDYVFASFCFACVRGPNDLFPYVRLFIYIIRCVRVFGLVLLFYN